MTECHPDELFVLLSDGDGTMRSSDTPFGVAVTTEKEAERYVEEGGVGYTHSYTKVCVFKDKDDALRHAFPEKKKSLEANMSLAWDVTEDDMSTVLDGHNVSKTDDEIESLLVDVDVDTIEKNVLRYDNMEDQTASMLSDIEDQLMKASVIPKGEKKFNDPK